MNFLKKFKEKKNLLLQKENIYYNILIIIIFSLDRFSKIKIVSSFNEGTYFINNFINLDLIWNTGIGFGFLSSNSPIFYNTVTFIVGLTIIILFYFSIISKNFEKLIYSIIIGGACGNFYDRLIYNAVPDFIDLHYNSFHWFTFNVADIFITFGIVIFIIKSYFEKN
jgi:signal peptidase II